MCHNLNRSNSVFYHNLHRQTCSTLLHINQHRSLASVLTESNDWLYIYKHFKISHCPLNKYPIWGVTSTTLLSIFFPKFSLNFSGVIIKHPIKQLAGNIYNSLASDCSNTWLNKSDNIVDAVWHTHTHTHTWTTQLADWQYSITDATDDSQILIIDHKISKRATDEWTAVFFASKNNKKHVKQTNETNKTIVVNGVCVGVA